jgi:hypothetical protein
MSANMSVHVYHPDREQLLRDAHGALIFKDQHGVTHHGVSVVRAFPIEAPDEGLSVIGGDGHELAWIERISDLEQASRLLVHDELARREFMPVIEKLEAVSSFATPSTWTVRTNRGQTSFVLKGEEDIRRLRAHALLITDSHGVTYKVIDLQALDRLSRRLLDRFL